MARHRVASIAQRVTLYFARNHDEEMTTIDITIKFEVALGVVHKSLTPSVRDGLLKRVSKGSGRGRLTVYSAGPELLRLIGETRAQSNVPAPEANLVSA
jgi:hypothetical protein